jgi:CheY-like chemotaxis protein
VRRVLIVDDNHDSAELLALLLGREGHETRVAHDPQDAIPLARAFSPNVAFLDIGLPGMDGFELLRVLRASPELARCKFVAVTGYEELRETHPSQGFDAHLVKPIDFDVVVDLVCAIAEADLVSKPASA